MSRYFSTTKKESSGWYDVPDPLVPCLSVSDHEPVFTGLVNSRGDPIMRAPEPIGFHSPRVRG